MFLLRRVTLLHRIQHNLFIAPRPPQILLHLHTRLRHLLLLHLLRAAALREVVRTILPAAVVDDINT